MALFTTNYNDLKTQNDEYAPVPEGTYECFIEDTHPDATPRGTEYLKLNLRIRRDLDKALPDTNGKQHNRIVFVNVWKRKKTGKYDPSDLNYIMKAAGYPDNTPVKDWDDWTNKLVGKPVKVRVTIDKSEYQGNATERNQVWCNSFRPTDYPLQKKVQEDPFKDSKESDKEIDDKDLPF